MPVILRDGAGEMKPPGTTNAPGPRSGALVSRSSVPLPRGSRGDDQYRKGGQGVGAPKNDPLHPYTPLRTTAQRADARPDPSTRVVPAEASDRARGVGSAAI